MDGEPAATTPTPAGAEPAGDAANQINLKVCDQDGHEVYFKIKRTTPLRKLMDVYCQRQGQARTSFRFLYNGKRINDDATPEMMDMEDNDVIDALIQQTGGSRC
eukprot:TRINITY_DN277_c0_g1_i1.p1 TRINITY_DN277_c0_g1~~TRINITY_DN277_c0_g1_i1.p1  ORF type:complete len:104 (-),score=9.60 TRINITY_DN277_c0_g1_i1:163-474(-)